MSMQILAISADHAGFDLKEALKIHFADRVQWIDLGTFSKESVNYADFGKAMGRAITEGTAQHGVIVCGSGVGISIAANRYPAVRAALCTDPATARVARQHNDANVLALGARFVAVPVAIHCVEAFLDTPFEGGRHTVRVQSLRAPDDTAMLARRMRDSARVTGSFTLRSGKTSDVYFDKYQFEAQPSLLLDIARAMVPLIPAGTEVLAGLEMGGIPIATVLSQVTGIPCAFVRKKAKGYGTRRYAEGASLTGKRFSLVEDVVSSGGAILEAVEKLRADGLDPDCAICVIDRETGGKEALASHDLPLSSLFTWSQIDRAV